MSETPVLVTTSASGLMMMNSHPNVAKRRTALTASGIVDVIPRRPLYILVANINDKPTYLPKNMVVAVGETPPQCIVHLDGDEQVSPQPSAHGAKGDATIDTVNAVNYKAAEDRSSQMRRHQDVHAKDDAKRKDGWKQEVSIPDKYAEHRDAMLYMLSEFQTMSDGHLGRIKAVKHSIQLTSEDAKPIHSARYRAGPAVRKFKKEAIEN